MQNKISFQRVNINFYQVERSQNKMVVVYLRTVSHNITAGTEEIYSDFSSALSEAGIRVCPTTQHQDLWLDDNIGKIISEMKWHYIQSVAFKNAGWSK
jgi:hypothetical protein